MYISTLLAAALAVVAEAGPAGRKIGQKRSPQHVGMDPFDFPKRKSDAWVLPREQSQTVKRPAVKHYKRAGATIIPQNSNTTKYAVNGTALPYVDFDVGESYAGLLPLSYAANETRELFHWFFPSSNPDASDEILVWLNGGPGCSSLEGLLQENGPFKWDFGVWRPYRNTYSYTNLTNTVWVEYPLGTGFNQGKATATNEVDAAQEFLGFWRTFMDTYGLHGRKVYIAGESYAGYYVPYIASAMYADGNKDYFDLQATQINDPSTSYNAVQQQIPTKPFVDFNHNLFSLNQSFLNTIDKLDKSCGYKAYREKYLTFPPPGPLPGPPNQYGNVTGCNIHSAVQRAAQLVNPCFDVYQVATTCPTLFDPLGFPGSFDFVPDGWTLYFARPDVQEVIHAPQIDWQECTGGVLRRDTSPPSGLSVLPGVIEKNKRTIIAHGSLDYILLANGTLMMIQNMTWSGKQGFQKAPKDVFYVPYHIDYEIESYAGAGRMGTTHTERGLTWVETWLSGHMIPQYAPSAAYRQLEFLLGRIPSLSKVGTFTTQVDEGSLGNTALVADA